MVLIIAFALVVITTIAYAALTQQLNISGNAVLNSSRWDILFGDIGNGTTTTGSANAGSIRPNGFNSAGSMGGSLLISGTELTLPGDSVTFKFSINNMGTIDAKIADIVANLEFQGNGATATADKALAENNITWELTYTNGISLANGDELLTGASNQRWCFLKLEFNPDATEIPKAAVSISGSWTIDYVQK